MVDLSVDCKQITFINSVVLANFNIVLFCCLNLSPLELTCDIFFSPLPVP